MPWTESEYAEWKLGALLDHLASPRHLRDSAYTEVALHSTPSPGGRGFQPAPLAPLFADLPDLVPELPGLAAAGRPPHSVSLFVGNGSVSELHFAEGGGLIVQLSGCKRLVVAPPSSTEAFGLGEDICRFASANSSSEQAWGGLGPCLCGGDDTGSSWRSTPSGLALHGQAVPEAELFILCPGDAVYVPAYHWHAAYADMSEVLGLTATYFFDEVGRVRGHPLQEECLPPSAEEAEAQRSRLAASSGEL